MRVWSNSAFLLAITASSTFGLAQTWNAPTYTVARTLQNDRYGVDIEYSGWTWTDPSGVVHQFNGTSEYYKELNGYGKVITQSSSQLTNIQASDGSPFYLTTTGQCRTGYVSSVAYIYPKFQVVSVVYAPPGSRSFVNYGNSTIIGNSTSITSSFTNSIGITATTGSAFFGLVSGSSTYSANYTTSVSSGNSIAITKTSTSSLSVPGPADSDLGIDHDFDVVFVCLNPRIIVAGSPATNLKWTVSSDPRDTALGGDAEIVPLYVYQLKNPSAITDPELLTRLRREWAGPNQNITNADLAIMATQDPFWNDGTTGSNPATTNSRFVRIPAGFYSFTPPIPGGQPITTVNTLSYQQIATTNSSYTDSYSVGSTTSADVNFIGFIKLTSTSQYTWTHVVADSTTSGYGQTASFSLTGPTSAYTGPTEIIAYQDVIFGSFLFGYVGR